MFENKEVRGIYYTRFIASWLNAGGVIKNGRSENIRSGENWRFKRWLASLGFLSEEEIREIHNLAVNGKLELEDSAKEFLKNN